MLLSRELIKFLSVCAILQTSEETVNFVPFFILDMFLYGLRRWRRIGQAQCLWLHPAIILESETIRARWFGSEREWSIEMEPDGLVQNDSR